MRNRTFFTFTIVASAEICAACASAPPRVDGVASVAPSSGAYWAPPPAAVTTSSTPATPIPADIASRVNSLTVVDVTDIALRNNPATRESWEEARAAAFDLGAARTRLIPSVDGSVSASRTRTTGRTSSGSASNGSSNGAGTRTQYEPELSLNFLLFDFGGRSGSIEEARQNVFAASLAHNATVQNTVLQVQSAYFTYMATKSLLGAQESQLKEAQANLAAANQRHDVGLATIADVLQARTAVSQAQLAFETTQGDLQAARGALAAAMGLPANLPYDISARAQDIPVRALAVSVDSLIANAVRSRPDLQSVQASARAADARIGIARSAGLPSVSLGGNAGRTYTSPSSLGGRSYGLSLGVSVPIVSALTNRYNVQAARADAAAAHARADETRQSVIQQVFASYYTLQTATQRVATADDLLASALQSEQVAAGRYREGVGSIIDLLTAQSALADARAQQVQSRWQWSTALAQLAHDAGVLGLRGEAPIALSATPVVKPLPDSSAVTPPSPSNPGAPTPPDTTHSR